MTWWRRRDEIAEEIRQHLDERAAALVAAGLAPAEARLAARREFGNVARVEEQSWDVWRRPRIETLAADIRYAFRQFRRSPAFALTAILTVALGVGANTAIFSVIDAVALHPLPYRNPDRLVFLWANFQPRTNYYSVSYPAVPSGQPG